MAHRRRIRYTGTSRSFCHETAREMGHAWTLQLGEEVFEAVVAPLLRPQDAIIVPALTPEARAFVRQLAEAMERTGGLTPGAAGAPDRSRS